MAYTKSPYVWTEYTCYGIIRFFFWCDKIDVVESCDIIYHDLYIYICICISFIYIYIYIHSYLFIYIYIWAGFLVLLGINP